MTCVCGDTPGVGRYRCRRCFAIIELDEESDELPPCPKCGDCHWDRI
ncbi:MAG TPA: hypothetical protein PLM96_00450 [Methanoregulaceae archaeon]|nr:hypothetical protein [Methanolinea sp.]MDD3090119.1 hypothetical protein [Methanoregulaceae archaeon]HOP66297.1 hypothetical protein [Methanoregulaceae archaeon]HPQ75104.1 hypothetical protein [Methanoregulaceae archaeon]HQC12959.1 hypothetical protein [Methanoregulaceae archaeon]